MRVRRPLWRSYTERFMARAAEHVRAGGHAMVWRRGTSKNPVAWMLLPTDREGNPTELAMWAMLALSKSSFDIVRTGAAKGLAMMRIPRDYEQAVEEWCERDSMWRGTTRVVSFDCLECGSCCRDNRVTLYDEDYARWKAAGRDDLFGKAYLRNVKGIVMLRLLKEEPNNCVHLKSDNKCGIYHLRPYNCSAFPVGSEPCLESRREEMNLIDGAPLREPEDHFVPRFGR